MKNFRKLIEKLVEDGLIEIEFAESLNSEWIAGNRWRAKDFLIQKSELFTSCCLQNIILLFKNERLRIAYEEGLITSKDIQSLDLSTIEKNFTYQVCIEALRKNQQIDSKPIEKFSVSLWKPPATSSCDSYSNEVKPLQKWIRKLVMADIYRLDFATLLNEQCESLKDYDYWKIQELFTDAVPPEVMSQLVINNTSLFIADETFRELFEIGLITVEQVKDFNLYDARLYFYHDIFMEALLKKAVTLEQVYYFQDIKQILFLSQHSYKVRDKLCAYIGEEIDVINEKLKSLETGEFQSLFITKDWAYQYTFTNMRASIDWVINDRFENAIKAFYSPISCAEENRATTNIRRFSP